MKPPDSTCWDWIHRAASDSFGTADRPVPRKPIVSLIQGLSIRQVFMDVDTIRPGLYRGVAAFFPP